MDELFGVRLFAKMKMRCQRVLEEMDKKVTSKNQQGRSVSGKAQALRQHLQEGSSQHKAGPEGHEVLQIAAVPVPVDDGGTADQVGGSSGQAKQNTGKNRAHRETRQNTRSSAVADVQHVSI